MSNTVENIIEKMTEASSMRKAWCVYASWSNCGKPKLKKKGKLNENRGKFINFMGIGGICNNHHGSGNGCPDALSYYKSFY